MGSCCRRTLPLKAAAARVTEGERREGKGRGAPIPERLLARLWQERAARQGWLRTNRGQRLRVIYPGRPGRTAGPDFRNALLEVEGEGMVRGDVEIHRRQRDWQGHGHGRDPAYNGVAVHAALEVDTAQATTLESGGRPLVVSLAPLLAGANAAVAPSAEGLWALLTQRGYPQPATAEEVSVLLDRAGDARFLGKSGRFQGFLREQSPEQTLYEGILEALGYHQNQQPFLKLAGRAPYQALVRASQAIPPAGRAQAVEAWLLKLSGLLPTGAAAAVALPRTGFGSPMSGAEWHCFRLRPANHPRRRISGGAWLVARFLEPGLVAGLERVATAGKTRDLAAALTVAGREGGMAYIGLGRARDLAVNVVLPFLHGLATVRGEPGGGEAYLGLYQRFGKLQENGVTREMAGQLLSPGATDLVKTARRQQGLIHLHRLLTGAS